MYMRTALSMALANTDREVFSLIRIFYLLSFYHILPRCFVSFILQSHADCT
jgi:hypothetical protein